MPTYEYECSQCGPFDVFQRMSDDPLGVCPTCGNPVRRKINGGTGVIFKGSGFYKNDSRKSSSSSKSTDSSEKAPAACSCCASSSTCDSAAKSSSD
jgi:putative FmdB family regulatory protein